MLKPLSLGGLLGGLVLFVWGAVSYMVLPWHTTTLNKFKDEGAVAQALVANANGSGMYILPNPHRHDPSLNEAQRKAAEEDGMKRMMVGPFMFASLSLHGTREMGPALLLNAIGNIVSAALVAWLLSQTVLVPYWHRVGFVVVIAFATAMIAHYPSWIWWRFSESFTLVECADLLIGWSLAGLVIAKIVPAR